MATAKPKSVQEAILRVMNDVGYVKKTGTMEFGRTSYTFAQERELIAALRPSMVANGLIMVPKGVTPGTETYDTFTKNSKLWRIYRAEFRFEISHPDSDTSILVSVPGEGADNGDKASNKAATGAVKYALRQTFLIETGDDPDNTSSDEISGDEHNTVTKAEDSKEKATTPKTDDTAMQKALAYKVPAGLPHKGDTIAKAMTQKPTGVMVISFLAGMEPSGNGTMYEPKDEEGQKVQAAAKFVYGNHAEFKKLLAEYKKTVN
jgi:hypothetical protein